MKKYHDVKNIYFEDHYICLTVDCKEYRIDLKKQSKILLNASDEERNHYEISPSGYGIHWLHLDEDLSIDGLIGVKHKIHKDAIAI
jgi:hypothetical protein